MSPKTRELEALMLESLEHHLIFRMGKDKASLQSLTLREMFEIVYEDMQKRFEDKTAITCGSALAAFSIAEKFSWLTSNGELVVDK